MDLKQLDKISGKKPEGVASEISETEEGARMSDPWGLKPNEPRPHSARFSEPLLPILAEAAKGYPSVLDPLAGTGRVGCLKKYGYTGKIIANELEPEWASQCEANGCDEVLIGDAATAKFPPFHCVVTSPTYGNRMADNFKTHRPKSMRGRYAGDLGRTPSDGSACCLEFGPEYRRVYRQIFQNVVNQLPSGGRVVLNVSDFIRLYKRVGVSRWYKRLLTWRLGLVFRETIPVKTRRLRNVGANSHLRVPHEVVMVFDKP